MIVESELGRGCQVSNDFAVLGMREHDRPISASMRSALEKFEDEGMILVVSSFGRGGGGLGAIGVDGVDVLDRISTKGIDSDGQMVVRAIDSVGGVRSGPKWGEIALYDGDGLIRLERIDGVGDLHDVLIEGDSVAFVSSASEQVLRYRSDGLRPSIEVIHETGSGTDMVHFNCLSRGDRPLAVSAFARDASRSWRAEEDLGRTDRGVVIDIESGEPIVEGLSQPHSPRRWRDSWVLADAGNRCITIAGDDGVRRSIDCGGFARGLHVHGDLAWVGVAPERMSMNVVADPSATPMAPTSMPSLSRVLLIDLVEGSIIGEIGIPFVEVYDLLPVPSGLVAGLRAGASSSALRLLERAAIERLWPDRTDPVAVEPIPDVDRDVSIEILHEGPMTAGSTTIVRVSVTNRGGSTLASVGSNRVLVGWWWGQSGEAGRGGCGLVAPIGPGETVTIPCPVDVPDRAGIQRLGVGVVQEGVGPFGGSTACAVIVEAEKIDS